ncbi:uncharacterized protein LOC143019076 [Oratosquilla oratoria]|uniref:uncharacterized protein LOC143019076 n=1 Tax=Oratosquilla oratoria TaxID=337810 RepID=UPI003F76719F
MKLHLCIVAVLVALAVGDDDDGERDLRVARSPQRFGLSNPFSSPAVGVPSGIQRGILREQRRQIRREQRRQQRRLQRQFGLGRPGFGRPVFGGGALGLGGLVGALSNLGGGINTGFGVGQNSFGIGSVKPGQCPPVRPVCPRTFAPPITCFSDASCAGVDKCCFDRCLGERVCKPPLGLGR